MKSSLYFYYYFISSFFATVYCKLVIIDCTFPCINSNQICQVDDQAIQCTEKTNNTKWILESANTLPVYQLSKIGLGQTCTIAPQPQLKTTTNNTVTNSTETVIHWPINGYDSYYSNCAAHLYCDKADVCVKQVDQGQECESSHQCLDGECISNTCTSLTTTNVNNNTTGFTAVHISIVVVGTILFFAVLIGLCTYYQRKKKRTNESQQLPKLEQFVSPTPSIHINILDPHYDPNVMLDRPTIQQQQLQYKLQRQLHNNEMKSPPPYSP